MLAIRSVLLLVALVPALVSAETWRWYDKDGQPHYTNVEAHAPAGADRVEGRIGLLRGRIGRMPVSRRGRHARTATVYRERPYEAPSASWAPGSCWVTGGLAAYPVTGCQLPSRLWLVDAAAQLESRKCGGF
jgi:hypothetical protein